MSKYVFGIDLGTTYSCIARVDETGRAEVIKNLEGENITPSVVAFEDDTVIVGSDAKEESSIKPETTVLLVKSYMGKEISMLDYNGEPKMPEEISSYILKKLARDASEQLGVEVKDVVITCPAYFGTAERTATKNAGKIAGLNVLEIISEPTAAAIYYGCTRKHDEKTVLVYDLGGGTFDVTVMRISADKIEVVCSDGDHDLGGKNWDETLMSYLINQFSQKVGYEVEPDEYLDQRLREMAEKLKKRLTATTKASGILEGDAKQEKLSVTREDFDRMTSIYLRETMNKVETVLEISKNKGYQIDEVLLVGGSTRMPQVKETLEAKFGKEKVHFLEPDEAVAKGAAIHAVNVYVNNQKNLSEKDFESEENIKVNIDGDIKELNAKDYKEKLSFSPEIMSLGGKAREVVMTTTKSFALNPIVNGRQIGYNMIIKNQLMNNGFLEVSKVFGTYLPNQETVDITIYENDSMEEYFELEENLKLGKVTLELPKNLPKGSPIEITLKLTKEGILEVKGLDKTSNKEVKVEMNTKGIMSKQELERIKNKVQGITLI
ncbi:Hsp70 family protein [Leptotrichia buccalis]|uniref:2-alkenal reductase n=1 Tax=Leptotrichia buccalis (strain ATCC 14201 / DSM 1135 / JCM 12969 / NCTC 10249 / C-1013-b) TaxID=523794 RepID=C7N9U5_LEPBD|nr:Hsp70 family protein [Leptotrichia buccalis]ACV38926.1 2-alkenal reductase [Leptotrichia buccalis C-1013-b]